MMDRRHFFASLGAAGLALTELTAEARRQHKRKKPKQTVQSEACGTQGCKCTTRSDCLPGGTGVSCVNGRCKYTCTILSGCPGASICGVNGYCSSGAHCPYPDFDQNPCASHSHCQYPNYCDPGDWTCKTRPCGASGWCPQGSTCLNGWCRVCQTGVGGTHYACDWTGQCYAGCPAGPECP